ALAKLGRYLKLELLKESPLAFAWVGWAFESAVHWLFGVLSGFVVRWLCKRGKKHWLDFHETRKHQAVPILESVLDDATRSTLEHAHAVETLGLIANQRFHTALDPRMAAKTWIASLRRDNGK